MNSSEPKGRQSLGASLTSSMNPLTAFITCSACNGHGTYWKPSFTYTQPVLAKCQACEGTGQVLLCTYCGAKLSYGRLGRSCGCNSVALAIPEAA
jgi:DnaJ-class molecular chaperone